MLFNVDWDAYLVAYESGSQGKQRGSESAKKDERKEENVCWLSLFINLKTLNITSRRYKFRKD